jgi:hypothetical protein
LKSRRRSNFQTTSKYNQISPRWECQKLQKSKTPAVSPLPLNRIKSQFKKVRFIDIHNEDIQCAPREKNRSIWGSYWDKGFQNLKINDKIATQREIESAEFAPSIIHPQSLTTKSNTSKLSTMQSWLGKLEERSLQKRKDLFLGRVKFKTPTVTSSTYKIPNFLKQKRQAMLTFNKLQKKYSRGLDLIMKEWEEEGKKDSKSLRRDILVEVFLDDLRNRKFNECMDILKVLEETHSDSITRLFYLMKNFLVNFLMI